MADKKISDLTLRSAVVDSVSLPGDDGVQTYRVTASQFWDYIWAKISSTPATITAAGTVITSAMKIILLDPTSLSFTQELPAAAGCSGFRITFKNIATNGNTVTLDPSGAETIEGAATLVLNSSPAMDSVTIFCNGTTWYVV